MKDMVCSALKYVNNQLSILDQQKLPHIEEWLVCNSPDEMIAILRALKVRGAPLIGIAAAVALADFVVKGASEKEILTAAEKLMAARPTAVNLKYCIEKQLNAYRHERDSKAIIAMAEQLFDEDVKMCEAIVNYGAELIQSGESILTHCNTGGIIAAGIGTALGVIFKAHQQGKKIHVYVDETRPLLQGARLTTWELIKNKIPHTLICDNMAASLMQAGKIKRVIVGADRIAANGDAANKIGTYGVAVLAQYHDIPFHIAAPESTIDWNCMSGNGIVIEQRAAEEVRGYGNLQWSPSESSVYNPAFDVTPARLIKSFITNRGVFEDLQSIKNKI